MQWSPKVSKDARSRHLRPVRSACCCVAPAQNEPVVGRAQVERSNPDGPVKVTLDLSGDSGSSGSADADAPEATDDDTSSFLESMGFGALGGMGGFELLNPDTDPGSMGALPT